MRNIGLLLIGALALSFSSVAEEKDHVKRLLENVNVSAKTLNLRSEQFMRAAHKFERLEENGSDMLPLHETATFKEVATYVANEMEVPALLQDRLQSLINERKAKLASLLGLDVNYLEAFLDYYSEQRMGRLNSSTQHAIAGVTETITVVCSGDGCMPGSPYSINMSLTIYQKAVSAGIQPYTQFRVEFNKQNTTPTTKAEIWKYNDYSGAWMVRSAPCTQCHVDY